MPVNCACLLYIYELIIKKRRTCGTKETYPLPYAKEMIEQIREEMKHGHKGYKVKLEAKIILR